MPESTTFPTDALVVTAHQQLGQSLRAELEAEGWKTIVTNSPAPARRLIRRGNIGLLILGEEVMPEASSQLGPLLLALADEIPVILLADPEATERRAKWHGLEPDSILDLPIDPDQLRGALRRIGGLSDEARSPRILGRSDAILQIREIIGQIAPTPVSVLITGESGTGKDLVAQAIHQNSPRRSQRLLTVNCGAIPETLLESELFGHEKGAFTDARARRQGIFEAADGGTVFLDEIGEMSLPAQVRLLGVLEAREITRLGGTQPIKVDVRIIAATNRDLKEAVESGQFRRDLYYRLRVVEVPVPPLRTRPEDIPILTDHFIQLYSQENGVPPVELDEPSAAVLRTYRWPGNVRELKNLVERLMVLSVSRKVGTDEIRSHLHELDGAAAETATLPVHLDKTPEESYRDLLYWAVLEVARDIKELKAYLMGGRPADVRSLPVYPARRSPLDEQGTEVEYTESRPPTEPVEDIKPLRDIEREAIARALRTTGGHRKRAARLLDMPERTLYRKIRQYGLS